MIFGKSLALDFAGMTDVMPWWLGGEEICPHCSGRYAYEVEIRCVDCDRPSCPHCYVIVRKQELSCRECSTEET